MENYLADALECGHNEEDFDGLAWVPEPRDPYYSRFDHLHPEEDDEGVPVVILPKFWQTF